MNRRTAFIGLIAVALALVSACTQTPVRPKPDPVIVLAGNPAGIYYNYAEALQRTFPRSAGTISIVATSGSVEDIDLLSNGKAAFGFTGVEEADAALAGRAPFSHPVPLRAVARLYDNYLQVVVRANSTVHSLTGLRGLRVSTGEAGSGTEVTADQLLGVDGLDARRDLTVVPLDLAGSEAALAAGRIDAFFWCGGLPSGGISDLTRTGTGRLLDLQSEARKMREVYGTVYQVGVIPAGIYPRVNQLSTVTQPNLLVTLAATDPDRVREFTQALFATAAAQGQTVPVAKELDPLEAIYTEPIALHPGALEYYRSIKPGLDGYQD